MNAQPEELEDAYRKLYEAFDRDRTKWAVRFYAALLIAVCVILACNYLTNRLVVNLLFILLFLLGMLNGLCCEKIMASFKAEQHVKSMRTEKHVDNPDIPGAPQ